MPDLDNAHLSLLVKALTEPVVLNAQAAGALAQIKVDQLLRIRESVVVTGWCSNPDVEITLEDGVRPLPTACLWHSRPDVSQALGMTAETPVGFAAIVDLAPKAQLSLKVLYQGQTYTCPLEDFTLESALQDPSMIAKVASSLANMTIASPEWSARLALLEDARFKPDELSGFVDHAYMTDAGGVVSGWVLARPETQVWIEDDTGHAYGLSEAFRWWRQDVAEADTALSDGGRKTGFLRALTSSRGARSFRLGGCNANGRFFVPGTEVVRVRTDVRSMGEALFGIATPRFDLVQRANAVDIPLLARIQRAEQAAQAFTKPTLRSYGSVPESPTVSIIIPLYARYDMIELQLLEFAKDPDFKTTCEVIYVNDDPRHAQTLLGMAGPLHDIIGVPFHIVFSAHNLGFSGANTLGAKQAKGDTLIFMNSDVFPNHIGWASTLVQNLDDNPQFGILAPRLVFPNGSLQHIGMEPVWRDAFGLWTNRHPMMGFDPSCDPAKTLQEVPLLSGACVAMRAADLEAIGGWSTDYLIGDFEDSDLCLRLNETGLKTGYLPTVSMTHLERQSMIGIGDDTFRERITLLNAALYNKRWFNALKRMSA